MIFRDISLDFYAGSGNRLTNHSSGHNDPQKTRSYRNPGAETISGQSAEYYLKILKFVFRFQSGYDL